jgi:lipopolysaccharide transport system ATP-binding protein
VKRYSSGMYVRLAFAVAAHLETEILLVDEVLAVGDAQFQKKCLGKIGEVAQSGKTVLFVSHNMGAIRALCTDVIWLNEGTVISRARSMAVVDDYLRTTIEQSGSSINLEHARRGADAGLRLRIKSVEFNGGTPILHGEPLVARIEYKTNSDITGVAFGLGFSSLEGIRLISFDTDLSEDQKDVAKNFSGVVEARVSELQLQPGRYLLDIGARSGATSLLDYLPGCAQVEVLPGPQTPPIIIRETGGMRIPAEWKWGTNGSN